MLLRQEEKADECQCLDASVGDFQVSRDSIVPVFRLAPAHAAPDPSFSIIIPKVFAGTSGFIRRIPVRGGVLRTALRGSIF